MPQSPPWNPSKGVRITIGLLTLWPPIYFALFMVSIGFSFLWLSNPSHKGGDAGPFMFIFPLHCLTMLLMFALMAVYIVHAFKNSRLTQETRILWVIILFMGSIFAFPVYWWLYLRPTSEEAGG